MAEYYRSLDDANAYFDDQLFATDWTGASDAIKIKGLIQSVRAIDSLKWKGDKKTVFDVLVLNPSATQLDLEAADAAQAKDWPRDGDDFAADSIATVQTLKAWATPPTAGNFTLQITLANAETFTTAVITYNAAASVIETAIDVAATAASITGWTNGDIVATGGAIDAADVVLTFSGVSVAGQSHNERPVVVGDVTFLSDGVLAVPASTVTITGECPDKLFFAQCEEAMTLISGRDPRQEFENAVLTSDGVSSARVSSDRGQKPPIHTAHMFTSALAWRYLAGLLDHKSNNSFKIERS